MDTETVTTIALLLLYFLFQMSSRKKKAEKARQTIPNRPVAQASRPAPQSYGFEDALREIRQALGEPETALPPVPQGQYKKDTEDLDFHEEGQIKEPDTLEKTQFQEAGPLEITSFKEPPVYEKNLALEDVIRKRSEKKVKSLFAADSDFHKPVKAVLHGISDDAGVPSQRRISGGYVKKLRNPLNVREALIFSEILEKPLSLRKRRNPG